MFVLKPPSGIGVPGSNVLSEMKSGHTLHKYIIIVITYMKKLLDSDWLRAVQLISNTSAKSVIPMAQSVMLVQITLSKLLNPIFSPQV